MLLVTSDIESLFEITIIQDRKGIIGLGLTP